MTPRIEQLQEKQLVGITMTMSLVNNRTGELWQRFGPRIKEIVGRVSTDSISLQIYPAGYYDHFSPATEFEKWAAVEVVHLNTLPTEIEPYTLPAGTYAVFVYKGSSADTSIYQYIFGEWLPNSPYQVDDRPHFEVLGERYKNNDPDSEEEIWIPIK